MTNPTPLDTPCREWPMARSTTGYGVTTRNGRQWRVHRWIMALVHGPAAIEDKVVMHLCDNPPCFRYDHLRIGTHADNIADRDAKGRQRNQHGNTHCKNGHEFTPDNTRTRTDGGRRCKTCEYLTGRRRAERNRHRD